MKPIKINKEHLKGYSVSPYNFVSFPKFSVTRYDSLEELPPHDSYKDNKGRELLNGLIEYTIVAKTPVMVSKGTKDNEANFFINSKGEFAIPGSTIRGLIKNNAEILSFSSVVGNENSDGKYVNSEIEDSKFMYRDIAGNNALSEAYKKELGISDNRRNHSVVKNVKAGYIFKKNDKEYAIEPAREISETKGNYYFRVDEIDLRKIIDKDMESKMESKNDFMYTKELINKEEELKREKNRKTKNNILKSITNGSYLAYKEKISFNYDKSKNRIVKVGEEGKYSYNGYIVCSEYMTDTGKRRHFIIPEGDDSAKLIDISYDDILHYENDLIRTKKMDKDRNMNKNKKFFGLPSKLGMQYKKPVFFIKSQDILHFGFGPYLRIFYRNSVLDGIPKNYKNKEGISYADAIFGFSNKIINLREEDMASYKTRVSFEDVIVKEKDVLDNDSSIEMLLAEPKPTSYNLYLKQHIKDNEKDLNIYNGDFQIRGVKQYWLKDYIELPEIGTNKKMPFYIHPIKEGTKFKGRIHFNNLYEDELGLILWALKLNDDCYQNIGLAKSYGFGRIKVEEIILKVEDLERKYTTFSFDFMKEDSIDKYINEYKIQFSKAYLNNKNIDETIPVKELMYIKSRIVKDSEANEFRYMEMQSKEFKNKKVLPEILQMDNKELLSSLSSNNSKQYTNRNGNSNFKNNSYRNNRSGQGYSNTRGRNSNCSYENKNGSKDSSINNKSSKRNTRFSDSTVKDDSLAEKLEKLKNFYNNK